MDYADIIKGNCKPKQFRFQKNPLFYLSSFQYPIAKDPAAYAAGFFMYVDRIADPREEDPYGGSGKKVFKDGEPALAEGGIVFLFAAQGPADALGFPEFLADIDAGIFSVREFVGHEIGDSEEIA